MLFLLVSLAMVFVVVLMLLAVEGWVLITFQFVFALFDTIADFFKRKRK